METLEIVPQKFRRREEKREYKALVAAKIERSIEKELLSWLKGKVYNIDQEAFQRALE